MTWAPAVYSCNTRRWQPVRGWFTDSACETARRWAIRVSGNPEKMSNPSRFRPTLSPARPERT